MTTVKGADSRGFGGGLMLLGAAIASLCAARPAEAQAQAQAQTGAQAGGQLEEIVVSARRRAESFHDAPVTITAFGQQEIENAGIERPRDFIALTPNVTLVETQNQGNAFVTVRGISQARNSEPSVAVLVDGVQMTNPAQFNQELFDVQQIEVYKGPQGALYGRNAIGGAIVITTRPPTDEFEGHVQVGYDSGPGYRAVVSGSGPLGDSDTLKYHAALGYIDTDGYIDNPYLGEKADPYKDVSGRLRLLWEPSDRLRTDSRLFISRLDTQALYFNIVTDVNDTHLPVRVNNAGENGRDLSQLAFKLDYDTDLGTLTSITSADRTEEILTGDAFDFLPITESFFYNLFTGIFGPGNGFDLNQSQYLKVDNVSEDLRFTSKQQGRFNWIAGLYAITTDRFISTGNMIDTGNGVFPVFRTPSTNPLNPQFSFLADSQDNFAWAVYADATIDLTDELQLELGLRYDNDHREQTTLTPPNFLAQVNVPGFPQGVTGEVRKHTWKETQPKVTLRYQPSDTVTIYGDYGKGFRSGGFNQTGVGAVAFANGFLGVHDLFDAEVAWTLEFGVKAALLDRRLNANFSIYDTDAEGSYFFVFLPVNSTQNLGNLDKVNYRGYEFDVTAQIADNLNLTVGYGATDSDIREAEDPTWIGNQAPLVSKSTTNAGIQYTPPIGGAGLKLLVRADYQRIGDTYWDPQNSTVRNPVNLLDLRLGVNSDTWSVAGWARNVNDVKYNAEFSPGGFVFKAKPRRWGVDFTKNF
ncbi:MAG TPA: TonB-dependent receptor [Gammaproteobacteria bacterium]|nr:TonB-dependent receptor [Gammaproteobacteria bacterium]